MKLDFSKEFIEEVKAANDIIEVASEYFKLQESGDNYIAHCKHTGGDKTPSLTFFPETQSFYCFGCHAGGRNDKTNGSDVIAFIEWVENIPWQDAVIYLARRKGIPLPAATLSKEEHAKQQLYDKILEENRKYWVQLQQDDTVRNWFYNRGIVDDDIAKWRLGSDNGVPVYAIIDEFGRTVGFSRRTDNGKQKYVNDPTSPIFKKGDILYGLNFVKRQIRQLKCIVIVEGYNDAILLQKYGVPACSIMGTSLTDGQIRLIKKYTNNVVLFLDGDDAGIQSTIEHIKALKREQIEVEVINVNGFDPDDIALKYKDKTLSFIVSNKRLAFEFLLNRAIDKYFDNMIRLKKDILRQAEEILECIENDEERMMYKAQVFRLICMDDRDRDIM